jgi:hypothetical protein
MSPGQQKKCSIDRLHSSPARILSHRETVSHAMESGLLYAGQGSFTQVVNPADGHRFRREQLRDLVNGHPVAHPIPGFPGLVIVVALGAVGQEDENLTSLCGWSVRGTVLVCLESSVEL